MLKRVIYALAFLFGLAWSPVAAQQIEGGIDINVDDNRVGHSYSYVHREYMGFIRPAVTAGAFTLPLGDHDEDDEIFVIAGLRIEATSRVYVQWQAGWLGEYHDKGEDGDYESADPDLFAVLSAGVRMWGPLGVNARWIYDFAAIGDIGDATLGFTVGGFLRL